MNIIIIGCGEVGETLTRELFEEGNDITVVDLSAERVKSITEKLDVMGVVGNGATHTTLIEAGVEKSDLLISVTESDELNLLCCMIAKKNSNCQVIARVRNPQYSTEADYLKDELGLAMVINPEYAVAEEISRVLRFPAAMQIETFAKGRVELLKFKLDGDNVLAGTSVKDMVTKLRCNVLVCTVERGDDVFIPKGNFVFSADDIVSVIASPKSAADFFKKMGYKGHSVKDAIVLGAGSTTHYLASLLKNSGISLKVIDRDVQKCEELGEAHSELTVINGDETDQELLLEEGITRTDAFVVLTQNDEENILLSLFSKNSGDAKVITKIDRTEYSDIIKHLNLDTPIYPKNITADMIARYVRSAKNARGSNVENMYNFIKGKAEATEFTVKSGSLITDIPLAEMKLKKDVLIAAILRGGAVIIPRGQDTIKVGDSVVVVSKLLGLHDISEIQG